MQKQVGSKLASLADNNRHADRLEPKPRLDVTGCKSSQKVSRMMPQIMGFSLLIVHFINLLKCQAGHKVIDRVTAFIPCSVDGPERPMEPHS